MRQRGEIVGQRDGVPIPLSAVATVTVADGPSEIRRIGQKRAVQVIKLITEGTLEEKISAIIDRKRRMMESVVMEDDPHLAKIFSREELLEMLRGA